MSWRKCPPQKEVVEGQGRERDREEARPQASEETAHRDGEKEARRRGIDGPSHRQRDTAGNCRQAVTLKWREAFIRGRRAEAQASPPF